jgi:hypothetical protein
MEHQTLTDLDQQDAARRAKAATYERLVGEKITLEGSIRAFEKDTLSTETLEKIVALVQNVPEDLSTRSGFGYPGGYDVKTILRSVTGNALNDVQRKCGQRDESLKKSREQLAKVDQQLAEFDTEGNV